MKVVRIILSLLFVLAALWMWWEAYGLYLDATAPTALPAVASYFQGQAIAGLGIGFVAAVIAFFLWPKRD